MDDFKPVCGSNPVQQVEAGFSVHPKRTHQERGQFREDVIAGNNARALLLTGENKSNS